MSETQTAGRTREIRIFISYARKDGYELAQRLYRQFNARKGWSAWMDTNLRAEEMFSVEIQKAILAADYMVVVLSPDVNRDNPPSFVQRELLFATQEEIGKKVFAVKAAPCFVPVIIAGVTWLPFHSGDFAANFETLCAKIENVRLPVSAATQTLAIPNRRQLELAYLQDLAKQYGVWGKVYTDMSATQQYMPATPEAEIADQDVMSVLNEMFEQVEMAFDQYISSGHSADDDADKQPLETFASLTDAIGQVSRLALLGEPGCGKTTTLRRIALDLALAATNDDSSHAPLPILVPLGNFNGGSLETCLEANFGGLALSDYAPDSLVILLDGLNETAVEHVPEVQHWLDSNPTARVIVTCRKLDYLERKLDLQRIDIQPLDVFRIRQFMANWGLSTEAIDALFWGLAGNVMAGIWTAWRNEGDTFAHFWTAQKLERDMLAYPKTSITQENAYNAMRRAMIDEQKLPGLLGLVSNPFLLTQTIFIYSKRHEVPRNRGELFTLFVTALIDQRGRLAIIPKRREWIDSNIQLGALSALATWLQTERKQTFATTAEVLTVFQQFIGRGPEQSGDLLTFAISANLLESKRDTLRFSHQLLQEYFAAHGMDAARKRGDSAEQYFPGDQWWQPSGWEESAVLLCGIAASKAQQNSDAWQVVEWLSPINPIVAWRCITENGLDSDHPAARALKIPQGGVRAAPLARARWGVEDADNDARSGVGLRPDGLPDLNWCVVPNDQAVIYQDREPTFYIAKYLITFAQFQPFIDAPDGFRDPTWWRGFHSNGLAQQRNGPGAQRWRLANYPRENVSWYDAMAFCRWLSAKLGYDITLPTESQLEKATRGPDGREYPYAGEFDPTKGNTRETGIGQTCAVGLFPEGVSPYGVLDLCGNVWEWTLTEYGSRKSDNLSSGLTRTLRGGSWYNYSTKARTVFRNNVKPNNRSDTNGFRAVCMAPI